MPGKVCSRPAQSLPQVPTPPVERGEPMIEFYAAVARKSRNGFRGPGWHPEQAVTREQALKMLTLWPAFAAFEEKDKGSIEAGKLADLTILSDDIMKIPEPEILADPLSHDRCGRRNCFRPGRVRSALDGSLIPVPSPPAGLSLAAC